MRSNYSANHLKSPLFHSHATQFIFPVIILNTNTLVFTFTASTVSLIYINQAGSSGRQTAHLESRLLQSALPCPFSVRTPEVRASAGRGAEPPEGVAAGQAGTGGPVAHSGVRFSLITRRGAAFVSDSRTLAGGGCAAPFSAFRGPWEAGARPGGSVPVGAFAGAQRWAVPPQGDWFAVAGAPAWRALVGDTLTEAEFLTLIWVLVEGPKNLTGLGPALQFTPSSCSPGAASLLFRIGAM